jgi:type IV pilus assembly protein PilB
MARRSPETQRRSSIKKTVKDQSGAGKIKIGELLSKAGYITPSQLEAAKKILKKKRWTAEHYFAAVRLY